MSWVIIGAIVVIAIAIYRDPELFLGALWTMLVAGAVAVLLITVGVWFVKGVSGG